MYKQLSGHHHATDRKAHRTADAAASTTSSCASRVTFTQLVKAHWLDQRYGHSLPATFGRALHTLLVPLTNFCVCMTAASIASIAAPAMCYHERVLPEEVVT
jgi:hypothetical protein